MQRSSDDLVDKLREMIAAKGAGLYGGEPVTQEQHAVQCAHFAEKDGAPAYLITAALLHDIGHLVQVDFETAQERGEDRFHEDLGNAFLKDWFDAEVTEPVRLHVAAKRYLCATDDGYHARLSPASAHTLRIQGGPMSAREVAEFEANASYKDAVRLRLWDDMAKVEGLKTAPLEHFFDYVRQSVAP